MVTELTGVKVTYGYDEFSNLVWSNQGDQFDFLHRSVDGVGNLYETKEKTDRVYGAGSRLLETKEATFSYDEEGNLIQKVKKNGDTWKYEYNGNGMMSKVIRPDNTEVTFKYDPLGRRTEKCSDEKTISFVWDGNTILHEYFSQNNSDKFEDLEEYSSQKKSEIPDNLVTWLFNDEFVPSAKITSEGNYSIVSDYLGTPVEAYDEKGNKVWSAELNIYGRMEEFTGQKDFIPFRYQGQYEDTETGLYYNRFRYYSPNEGVYTQIDPIGLAGGNPTLYGYVKDPNTWIDVFGLETIFVNPNDINFSQRTVSEVRVFDASKYTPLNVIKVDEQLVSYGNRRLLAAQNAGIEKLEVNVVKAEDKHPDSTKGKTWGQKFKERFNDIRNKKAGGVVPDKGLKEKPIVPCKK
nr:RHS repeat-associated core domain-containing protein [Lysinibacillus sphaericus]